MTKQEYFSHPKHVFPQLLIIILGFSLLLSHSLHKNKPWERDSNYTGTSAAINLTHLRCLSSQSAFRISDGRSFSRAPGAMPHRTAACGERAGSDRHAHPQLTRKGAAGGQLCLSREAALCRCGSPPRAHGTCGLRWEQGTDREAPQDGRIRGPEEAVSLV